MPCNVSTIDSGHKKRVDQTRRREELKEGLAGGWWGVTWARRYQLWDNVKMGKGVAGWDRETAQSLASHGSAMTLENVSSVL